MIIFSLKDDGFEEIAEDTDYPSEHDEDNYARNIAEGKIISHFLSKLKDWSL